MIQLNEVFPVFSHQPEADVQPFPDGIRFSGTNTGFKKLVLIQ
jgi:hypothetical protein